MSASDYILKLAQVYEVLVRCANASVVDAAESAPIRIALIEKIMKVLKEQNDPDSLR